MKRSCKELLGKKRRNCPSFEVLIESEEKGEVIFKKGYEKCVRNMRSFLYILLAAGFWGCGAFVSKLGVVSVGPWTVALIRSVVFFWIIFGFFLWREDSDFRRALELESSNVFSITAGVLTGVCVVLIPLSLKFFDVSLVSPMLRLNVLITVVLSLVFLHEDLTKRKAVGIVFAMLAFFLLS